MSRIDEQWTLKRLARPILLGFALLAAVIAPPAPSSVFAQSAPAEGTEGWLNDVNGLRHFAGLRCPDIIGTFYRTKVLSTDADRMAGCQYTGRDGMIAVLRQHLTGTGGNAAKTFLRSYRLAGFEKVEMTGIAASGISFRTRTWSDTPICETLWYFQGESADYTLWLAYTLPAQEADVEPAVNAFRQALAVLN
ncbi:hypothetical protein JM93_01348 [Roseibium hamelinense]|uniref:Uncharacterized protein n=1 Tax=Roseibium hamelinense TaxID=150831 RepID=A0A562T9L3_9HYPH|nr:hypothetical protein [Roseibium hamelinense]MTI45271.1 hypothetical protein [Roseibium hamelinense]TWI90367.1 hypothetical protein JM93_01348 [Roseibium hamelinense]